MKRLIILLMLFSIVINLGCGKEKTTYITNSDDDSNSNTNTLEDEKQNIVNVYLQWSQRTKSKDYEGAFALLENDSAALLDLQNMKYKWDDGKTCYYDFSNVQAVLSETDLRNGMGWAKGDATIIEDRKTYYKKFTSSCTRINNQWLIVAFFFQD